MTLTGFPHSDIFGSKLAWQLPEAYRSLLRPSSVIYVRGILYVRLSNFLRFTIRIYMRIVVVFKFSANGWLLVYTNNCRLSFEWFCNLKTKPSHLLTYLLKY